jgi:hypothetical protein
MSRRPDELLDEMRLRRALRLDAGELPPHIDVAAIAARAAAGDPATLAARVATTAIAALAMSALVVFVTVAVSSQMPALAASGFDGAIALLARIAVPVEGVLAFAEEPTVPVTLLAAALFASVYELTQRRERARVVTPS